MKLPIIAVLGVATLLGGCAKISASKFNPLNWTKPVVEGPLYTAPEEARALVASVTEVKIEPYPGGAIVRATGLPPTQGYWQAELVAQPLDADGRLVYDFRVFPPLTQVATGTPYARQITVAAAISTIKLQGVTSIVVQGASNSISARR